MESLRRAVVIGASLGGVDAITKILSTLQKSITYPIIIVQHLSSDASDFWFKHMSEKCNLQIKEAEDKETIEKGMVYVAPPNYHLLVEEDRTFSLSAGEKVNFSRPSIDVLFETAAEAYGPDLIGVILTGASSDGTKGMQKIKEYGGLTLAQDPATSEAKTMPCAAIKACTMDLIGSLDEISQYLNNLNVHN